MLKVSFEEAKAYADECGLLFMETSAKTAANVMDIFTSIAKKLPKGGDGSQGEGGASRSGGGSSRTAGAVNVGGANAAGANQTPSSSCACK